MRADTRTPGEFHERLGPQPRPVLEVFAEVLAADGRPAAAVRHHHGAWPRKQTSGSGYALVLAAIAAQADTVQAGSGGVADISPAILDAAGAPAQPFTWPADVTVRPLGPGQWVLDNTAPAGVLDARFIEMLEWLQGPVAHAVAYREFLSELDRRTGIRSVELLIPPQAERAANAVRRPRYVGAWSGDPDPGIYGRSWCGRGPSAPQFIPLADLSVQRTGDQILVMANGKPVRVLSHATRTAQGPWRLLASLLVDSAQRQLRACPLRWSLTAFGGRNWLPRITVAGSVVLSPAQWRISDTELWDPAESELARVRGLIRLSERRGVPRWVFVSAQPGAKPLPCDLESLRALPVLEQAAATGPPGLVLQEMLPPPSDNRLSQASGEPDDLVTAELMIRLPAEPHMSSLAAPSCPAEATKTRAANRWEEGR
jgi:hypothetical protein